MKTILRFLIFLLVASVCSAASFTIKWTDRNPSSRVTGFILERAPAGPSGYVTWTVIAMTGVSVRSFVDTGLSSNTMYQYRVRTYNATQTSPNSNIVAKVTRR